MATPIYISHNACEKFVERINPSLTIDQARAAIRASERAILCAAGFGCLNVITGAGARLVLQMELHAGVTVTTVEVARAWRHPAPGNMISRWGKAKRGRPS